MWVAIERLIEVATKNVIQNNLTVANQLDWKAHYERLVVIAKEM